MSLISLRITSLLVHLFWRQNTYEVSNHAFYTNRSDHSKLQNPEYQAPVSDTAVGDDEESDPDFFPSMREKVASR